MTAVLDASAILAFLQGEPGAAVVEDQLASNPRCGAANWSEVAQQVRGAGRDWALARALLASYGVAVDAVTEADGEWAAARWRRDEGLSLADRLCLALGHRLDAPVLTAARQWGQDGQVRQIR
jgi:ribonuclease VapC